MITMSPTPVDRGYEGAIARQLGILHRNGVPQWFGYNKLEFSANLVMFVPLGFLVALALPARVWWLAVVLCPGMSIAIESIQAAVLSARISTPTDVIANSIGAIIGITMAVGLRAVVHYRDQFVIAEALRARGLRA